MKKHLNITVSVTMDLSVESEPSRLSIIDAVSKALSHQPKVKGRCLIPVGGVKENGESIPFDEISFQAEYKPDRLLFGEQACRIMFEDDVDTLIEQIEEEGIDYDLYEYTGDLPDLLAKLQGWGDYAFLSDIEYAKLNEL